MSPDTPATPPSPEAAVPGGVPDRATGGGADDGTALLSLLADWLPGQRWFAGTSGDAARIALLDRAPVASIDDGADIELVLVRTETAAGAAIYQLLLAWRQDPPEHVGHAIIGTVGDRICYDALHDHAVTALLLSALARGGTLGALSAITEPDADIDAGDRGLIISAEQSNTSIVYGDAVILKMFRRLEPGTNPDAELHRALHAAGCEHIADPMAELTAPVDGVPTTIGLATRFFANSADGWAMATASVRDLMAEGDLHADEVGGDFAAESHRLGEAIAAVHLDLARALGGDTLPGAAVTELLASLSVQAERLAAAVPSLRPHLPAIRAYYDRAADALAGQSVPVQRIHGDLHLGQVLRTLHGWVVIDFEGEPSGSLAARRRPQSPLRDVAGMLRSFDYAAHQLFITGASDAQRSYRAIEWSRRNRAAFCAGYAATAGSDPQEAAALLGTFELAKAVYEVGYEHDHRPTWEQIPLAAVVELTGQG